MKRRYFFSTALLFFLLLPTTAVLAKESGGAASECLFSIKEVWLKDITGEWIKVPNSSGIFNAASDDPIFSYENKDGGIPEGDYDNFKIVLSETVKVAGRVGRNKTRSGGSITVGGTSPNVEAINTLEITTFTQDRPTWNEETEGEIIEHLNLDYEDDNDVMKIYGKRAFSKVLHIKKGSSIQLYFSFDRSEVMHYAWPNFFSGITSDKAMYFLPPAKVGEASLEVDAETAYLSGDQVEWEF